MRSISFASVDDGWAVSSLWSNWRGSWIPFASRRWNVFGRSNLVSSKIACWLLLSAAASCCRLWLRSHINCWSVMASAAVDFPFPVERFWRDRLHDNYCRGRPFQLLLQRPWRFPWLKRECGSIYCLAARGQLVLAPWMGPLACWLGRSNIRLCFLIWYQKVRTDRLQHRVSHCWRGNWLLRQVLWCINSGAYWVPVPSWLLPSFWRLFFARNELKDDQFRKTNQSLLTNKFLQAFL